MKSDYEDCLAHDAMPRTYSKGQSNVIVKSDGHQAKKKFVKLSDSVASIHEQDLKPTRCTVA